LASKSSRKKVNGDKTGSFFIGGEDLNGGRTAEQVESENIPSSCADSLCILLFLSRRITELKGVNDRSQFSFGEMK
jgi:hypothetical protein